MVDLTPEPGLPEGSDSLLVGVDGTCGRLELNRPKALNALDSPTAEALLRQLRAWADDPAVLSVCLTGAGGRALCAGGDVRALRTQALEEGPAVAARFWEVEYELNRAIAAYPKPYVAVMDGIVMGGGLGLSAHGSHRLVTERTVAAMPETAIGFHPDVGVLHLLARAPGELGTRVALTGESFTGADAVVLGLADALVESAHVPELLAELAQAQSRADVDALLTSTPEVVSPLAAQRPWVDACYAGGSAVAIVQALEEWQGEGSGAAEQADAARADARTLRERSPLSVAVTLAALRRASELDLEGVLAQDGRLAPRLLVEGDFTEGVRAKLVDKTNDPAWRHSSLEEVGADEVERLLA